MKISQANLNLSKVRMLVTKLDHLIIIVITKVTKLVCRLKDLMNMRSK